MFLALPSEVPSSFVPSEVLLRPLPLPLIKLSLKPSGSKEQWQTPLLWTAFLTRTSPLHLLCTFRHLHQCILTPKLNCYSRVGWVSGLIFTLTLPLLAYCNSPYHVLLSVPLRLSHSSHTHKKHLRTFMQKMAGGTPCTVSLSCSI